jgi:hypothetical protein
VGVLKLPRLGLPRLWGAITLCADLWLRWGLKQNYSPHWELFNGILHVIFTHGNRVDSWLLMVESQTANLTPDFSFGHNLYFRFPDGSCKPILNIYVPRAFQWYKERLNPLRFDPCDRPLKIWESTETPTPKVEPLRGVRVHSFTPSDTFESMLCDSRLQSWFATLQTLALVASPRLGLRKWTFTLSRELSLWELESRWTFESSESDFKGQKSID